MNNLKIDETIKHVMNIVNNNKCNLCDRTDGQRLRYRCGHTGCDKCVLDIEDCQICLSSNIGNLQPKLDDALTQRVKNASALLKSCQELFNIDVFERKRLSEQQRVEKELFPKCIQAPAKYENKRKSSLFCYTNKENRKSTYFPGEDISPLEENITMENTFSYVQQWLNKSNKDFTRKPFRDLNVNTQLETKAIFPKNYVKLQQKKTENTSVLKITRKRAHYKTTSKNNSQNGNMQPIIMQESNNFKKAKKEGLLSTTHACLETKKCDNDESGVFMDNDAIIIDDSQEMVVDKDTNAWLAVLEANKNDEIESTSAVNLDCSEAKSLISTKKQSHVTSDVTQIKVPFYKKGYLAETCSYCNDMLNKTSDPSKEVKITIDNVNFTTTIKIFKDVEKGSDLNSKTSVTVQTDICETNLMNQDNNLCIKDSGDDNEIENLNEKYCEQEISQKSDTESEDLFADDGKPSEKEYKQNIKNDVLFIEESDSDGDMQGSGPVPVKVDVHRSCDESEYGILGEIVNFQEHNMRPRHGPRGQTPTSTNSSEKENFNPNRMKKHSKKKKSLKK